MPHFAHLSENDPMDYYVLYSEEGFAYIHITLKNGVTVEYEYDTTLKFLTTSDDEYWQSLHWATRDYIASMAVIYAEKQRDANAV